jgi:hypothetical protein
MHGELHLHPSPTLLPRLADTNCLACAESCRPLNPRYSPIAISHPVCEDQRWGSTSRTSDDPTVKGTQRESWETRFAAARKLFDIDPGNPEGVGAADETIGGAVNIAARVSSLTAPGELLVSETIRSLARTSAGVMFEDRGEQELKGVGETVRVWAVKEAE